MVDLDKAPTRIPITAEWEESVDGTARVNALRPSGDPWSFDIEGLPLDPNAQREVVRAAISAFFALPQITPGIGWDVENSKCKVNGRIR